MDQAIGDNMFLSAPMPWPPREHPDRPWRIRWRERDPYGHTGYTIGEAGEYATRQDAEDAAARLRAEQPLSTVGGDFEVFDVVAERQAHRRAMKERTRR